MATFAEMIQRMESLALEAAAEKSVEETAEKIEEKNRQQLVEGFDSDGNRLLRYRSNKYARAKHEMNPLPGLGNPDLKVTGNFQRRIEVRVSDGDIVTNSDDPKAEDLEEKYGLGIYGLGVEKGNEYIRDDLHPVFKDKIANHLKLSFE